MGDIFVDTWVEVIELVFTKIRPAEGALEGKTVDDVELFPEGDLNMAFRTLAAPSLSFWTSNEQSLNWKTGQLFFISIGKICSFLEPSRAVHPSDIS
jgi:hypothetical protein